MTQNPQDPNNPQNPGEQPYGQQPSGFPPPAQPGYGAPQQPGVGGQPPAGQPGGVPTPDQGGFPAAPPPPPPSYGQYGAPPAYGGPAGDPSAGWGGTPAFTGGSAVGWAFRAYGSNVGYWLLWMLILLVVGGAIGWLLLGSAITDASGGGVSYSTMSLSITDRLLQAIVGIVWTLLGLVVVQGALHRVNGRLTAIGDFVKFDHLVPGLIAAVVVSVASGVLGLVPGVGGLLQLIVGVLTVFVVPIALDRGLGVVEAVTEGVKLVTGNLGQVIVMYLIFIGLIIAGAIVICGTGIVFVGIPVIMLASCYGYKVLTGQQVAPA